MIGYQTQVRNILFKILRDIISLSSVWNLQIKALLESKSLYAMTQLIIDGNKPILMDLSNNYFLFFATF